MICPCLKQKMLLSPHRIIIITSERLRCKNSILDIYVDIMLLSWLTNNVKVSKKYAFCARKFKIYWASSVVYATAGLRHHTGIWLLLAICKAFSAHRAGLVVCIYVGVLFLGLMRMWAGCNIHCVSPLWSLNEISSSILIDFIMTVCDGVLCCYMTVCDVIYWRFWVIY